MVQQVDAHGKLRHLLTTQGLSRAQILQILENAQSFFDANGNLRKTDDLLGTSVVNLFFENSTRTRSTFELAAKRLSADVLSLDIRTSATAKGETLLDTLRNLEAMQADMFVIRHSQSGAAHFFAEHAAPHVSILNAGDGRHAHPTQALLDMFTIQKHKGEFKNLKVAIIGDILFSRVARSQIAALNALEVGELCLAAPKTLLPAAVDAMGATVYHHLEPALKDADVVIMLRLQKERMDGALLPSESEYFSQWGLDNQRLGLAKPDAIVMHPGPINRGVEIASEVADGPNSVILDQVTNGIAVRMAVMKMCRDNAPEREACG